MKQAPSLVRDNAHRGSDIKVGGLLAAEMVRHGKALAAFCATTGQHLAAVGGCHSFTETVLVHSLAVGGLKCSFHRDLFSLFT